MIKILKIVASLVLVVFLFLAIGFFSLVKPDLDPSEIDNLYTNENSQFITLPSGQRVHIRDEGRKNAPVLILLHGSNASLHTWEPWVERLGESLRIITVDLPAHGLTGPSIKNDYSKASYVSFVDDVVRYLGIEQFVLGGNSMGGNISWRYTLKFPQKVRGLILVDASGYPVSSYDGPIIFKLLRYAPMRWLFQKIHLQSVVEEGVRNAYNNSPIITEKLIQRYVDLNLRAGNRKANALRFAQSGAEKLLPPPRNVINVPTLILWGKEDRLVPISIAKKFNRDFQNSTLVIYDNVGHVPNEEIAGRSARDVRTFLEGINWSKSVVAPSIR